MVESLFSEDISQYFIERELRLHSDNFYRTLDYNDEDLEKYYAECKEFSSNRHNNGLRRPCALVLNYLENIYNKFEKQNSAYDDCILLNYWIFGKIYEKHKDLTKSAISFGELQTLWNKIIEDPSKTSSNNKCKPRNLIALQEDWKKRKLLYDYCVDYDMLQSMLPYYDIPCNRIYMYLKEKVELYNEYKENCSTKESKKCPDFFSTCEKKDPNILLSSLECYGEMKKKEALAVKEETNPDLTVDKAGLSLDSRIAHEGTNPVTNSGNILLGVVVTSMTSGALYKFTPLGRMLRNGLGWNRNNINLHDNGLFEYAPGSFNPYSMGGDEHYIGYQPA